MGGRKRAEERLSEEVREQGGRGARMFFLGIPRRALASVQYIHKPFHNAALGLETLVLQMKNSEQGNYKLCIMMRHNLLFDRWMT